ncbi:MAG TPA: methyltransferase [Nitriliruptoraceae bacterium]|nr:methyltransferase [Nitriliruptoraceae bacterium]
MEPCRCADDYARMFGRSTAAGDAKRFRRRGLRGSAADLAEGIEDIGVDGGSILEVGGGVGGLTVHLLEHGAASAVNVELSPGYESEAARLLADRDLADRVERRIGDFVTSDGLEPVDVVALHRVVCCYPDWRAMLDRAADTATRTIGLTFPRDWWPGRAAVTVGNGFCRLSGTQFRAFVHPADDMLAFLARQGFEVRTDAVGLVWRTVVLARALH